MTPVAQSPDHRGNCLQAAIASVLDLPLNDVPDFAFRKTCKGHEYRCKDNLNWFTHLKKWARARGLGVVKFDPSSRLEIYNAWVVAVGKVKRRDKDTHAVVCRATTGDDHTNLSYVHDPSGRLDFIQSPLYCLFFTPGAA